MAQLKLSDAAIRFVVDCSEKAATNAPLAEARASGFAASLAGTTRVILDIVESELDLRDQRLRRQASRIAALERQLSEKDVS